MPNQLHTVAMPSPAAAIAGNSFLYSPILNPRATTTTPTRHRHSTIKMSLNTNNNNQNNKLNPITTLTKLLWGQSLPPNLLISTARFAWTTTWQLMMSQLAPSDSTGRYTRPSSQFRTTSSPTSLSSLHLYVGLPCPWAHRTLIVRALKGLDHSIPVSIASPGADGAWEFTTSLNSDSGETIRPSSDKANGCKTMKEVYGLRKGGYSGRCTVPMLWDVDRKEVVCNESYDIIEMFNSGFNRVAANPGLDLAPDELREKIDEWNRIIYPNVNNGVYRCGFAQSQEAYDGAVEELFGTLDTVDEHLGRCRYLCGDALTLADVCLFTTLIRFDLVYNVLFKCTKKKLIEYPNLHGYMRDIFQMPKVAETCNLGAIMDGYYKILFPLNPGSIRPIIPSGCQHDMLSRPHGRESLSVVQSNLEALV